MPPEELEASLDAAEPRAAFVRLLVGKRERAWAELEDLRLGALQQRAVAAGVAESELYAALDADAPKQQLISLLLQQPAAGSGGERAAATGAHTEVDTAERQLRAELGGLRLGALQRRAATHRPTPSARRLEGCLDSADPRAAMVSLLIELELHPPPADETQDHHPAPALAAAAAAAPAATTATATATTLARRRRAHTGGGVVRTAGGSSTRR
eukprot:COSAG01_NODE_96_length_26789_cov_36.697089_29_plen_213_part_00